MHILYMLPKTFPKVAKSCKKLQKFYCEQCDYSTSRKSSYTKHLSCKKHIQLSFPNVSKTFPKVAKSCKSVKKIYVCEYCNNEYSNRSGLWKHKKKCKNTKHVVDNDENIKLKLELAEKNIKLAKQEGKNEAYEKMINSGKIGVTNNNYNNCNNTNNNISLNVFLNDYCKDAINLEDFMKGIKFKLKDILKDGNYVEDCVSVKLLNDLNDIPVTQRPIHCTDKRRKNFVVKDKEEGWITEKGNQPGKIGKQINNLYSRAYIDFYHEYDEEHPLPHSNRQVDEKSETSSKIMQKKDKHYIIGTLAKNLDVKEAMKEIQTENADDLKDN